MISKPANDSLINDADGSKGDSYPLQDGIDKLVKWTEQWQMELDL